MFSSSRVLLTSFLLSAIAFGFSPLAFAYTSPGNPTGYVNDFAGVMSADAKANLEAELTQFHKDTGGDIVVAVVPSLGGDDIESYANTLFREWGVGNKDNDTGMMLVVAVEDRELRIEVGYGYEGVVPDLYASRIINNVITPRFKDGDFDGGISEGVASLIALAKDPNAVPPEEAPASFNFQNLGAVFYLGFFFIVWILNIMARTKSWWLGGVLGGGISVIGGLMFGLTAGLISFLPLVAIGLLVDFAVSRAYSESKAKGITPPWWIGGGGGFGGRGGGGFGGFGGGSSGGGGASGRW